MLSTPKYPYFDCYQNTFKWELCYISKADLFLGHPVLNARIPLFDTGTMWCETGSSLINKVIVNVQFILHLVCVGKLASLDIEWISFKLHLTFIDKMKLQESEILFKKTLLYHFLIDLWNWAKYLLLLLSSSSLQSCKQANVNI